MANAWVQLVTETYHNNKSKKNYSFKQAIKDAKKIYKQKPSDKNVKNNKTRKNNSRKNKK